MDIVGIIPSGGMATRIQPLPGSKELFPIGKLELSDGTFRPKVVSHYLLEKYQLGGATKTFFILKNGKWDIPAYFQDGHLVKMDLGYLIINKPYGVPYTIDQAYPFIKDNIVFLGFPDIIFNRKEVFKILKSKLISKKVDIALGLFPVESQKQASKCDMVDWDDQTGKIHEIVIKPESTALQHCWLIAVWTPEFTQFMHEYLPEEEKQRLSSKNPKEIFLGHVIQKAMKANLKVSGYLFENESYLDIGTPDDLFKAQTRFGN
ncbi:sugar phosphate nucleotidyltransferase [Flexithrix dorotheae]|uniref:sugar phosphate nucleotidyltransferase n=1 Tax=Flexithrix dorotheae TaxID=70993 RepID=UPI00036EBEA9|nr:sugar phosphate nucleotidyltransferase [Flexithrix dorotheae]